MNTVSTSSSGYIEHRGNYSVVLTQTANKGIVPSTVTVDGNVLRVKNGIVEQGVAGFNFSSGGETYFFGYSDIKVIRDSWGNQLWVNVDP